SCASGRWSALRPAPAEQGALATSAPFPLSLHGALPIFGQLLDHLGREADAHQFVQDGFLRLDVSVGLVSVALIRLAHFFELLGEDRKSTRLNSSHVKISYAVFCLKKNTHISHVTNSIRI